MPVSANCYLLCIMMALDTEIIFFFKFEQTTNLFYSYTSANMLVTLFSYALICCIIQSNICTTDIVFGIKVRMSGLCINRYRPIVRRRLSASR